MGQMIPMSVLGVGSLVGLFMLNIPLAFTLALFTAAMLFIPYAGAVVAYFATALVAFAKGPTSFLYVTGLYLGIHAAEAYVITPLAQRHAVRLPPAITIISQLLLWKVAGILGVFVATPLAAVCIVVVQRLYLKRKAPPEHLTASS
jgi:predicted PurR-regulated permease PerM